VLHSFIGREPVLDEHTSTFGYKLLIRGGIESLLDPKGGEETDPSILDDVAINEGLHLLSNNKRIFVNFSERLLLEGHWSALPAEKVIIELSDNIIPGPEVIDACKILKSNGYMLALDNFHYSSKLEPVVEISDILKINIKISTPLEVGAYAKKYRSNNVKLLASSVDSLQEYYSLRKLGYTYFQGYYFNSPEIIRSEQMPTSRIAKLRLIYEVNKIDFDFSIAEEILKHDPSLTVKLLKFVNSAALGLRSEVHGIRQALTMIGQRNLKKWISILAVSAFTEKKPSELMNTVVRRGQFCELLAPQFGFVKNEAQSLFLVGMFSLLDAVIDMPIEKVFEIVLLSDEIRNTVLGLKTPYKDILDLAITFEKGDWDKMNKIIRKNKLHELAVIGSHAQAIEWANSFVD